MSTKYRLKDASGRYFCTRLVLMPERTEDVEKAATLTEEEVAFIRQATIRSVPNQAFWWEPEPV